MRGPDHTQKAPTSCMTANAGRVVLFNGNPLATWVMLRQHNQQLASVVVDLRDRSTARGTEVLPAEPPLDIPRRAHSLEIYLPLGSGEGAYDVRIASPDGEALVSASGAATVKAGVASLRVQANLSSLRAGLYVLQIRRPHSNWNSFSLCIR
jgi:hypothetical protein